MDSVKANACCLSRAQAGAESFCRPGMWLPGVRNLHLATETWEIKAALNDTINAVVEGAVRVGEKENMEVHKVDKLELLVELWSFTPGCNWMDVVEIRFKNGDPASEVTIVEARSFSTGLCPALCPLTYICNCLCFCAPFSGNGFNSHRLEAIREAITTVPLTVINSGPSCC